MLARSALRRISLAASRSNKATLTQCSIRTDLLSSNKSISPVIRVFSTSKLCLTDVTNQGIQTKIDFMVKEADVVVFMKGVPASPRCGFSNAVCQIMRMHDVPFEAHDVLADEDIRQGNYICPKKIPKTLSYFDISCTNGIKTVISLICKIESI